jgi:membrane AbrB-like protein
MGIAGRRPSSPLASLALCAAAGAACAWLRLPLPWLIGPLLAMAACNTGGARLRAPPGGRQAGQLVIGTVLGLYFTPAVVREVVSYWHLLLLAALFALGLAAACGWLLSRVTGTDRTTAFFASVPGSAPEMTVLGERYGARPDRVALAQSLRLLVVVIVVPFALTYSGAHGADLYHPAAVPLHWAKLALLLGIGAAAGGALAATGAPNAFMFGPLFVAIAFTASEVQLSSVPGWLSGAAQLLLGCALGARFDRQFSAGLGHYAAAVLVVILLAIALAAAFGTALATLAGLPVPSLVLATAPGGIAEMCVTAQVLQLGVPLVTAAHVTRVVVLVSATAPIFRLARRLSARRATGCAGADPARRAASRRTG